ncbi:hypothetical protein ON010_g14180 [Phytophthora cinnamomi]|nr:hypothetical protein ON010_g14180 [Phytophthora cinnamomi]
MLGSEGTQVIGTSISSLRHGDGDSARQRLPPFSVIALTEQPMKESKQFSPRRLASLFTRKRDVSNLADTQVPVVAHLTEKLIVFSPTIAPFKDSLVTNPQEMKLKRKRVRRNPERRREQCRSSQARYRARQRDFEYNLEENVQRLREEVQSLSAHCYTVCYGIHTKRNVWSFAAEYFRLFRYGCLVPISEVEPRASTITSQLPTLQQQENFLRRSMSPLVVIGEIIGVDALSEQWQRYSTYFGNLHLNLMWMKEQPFGALNTSASLSITITETTLRCVFPHLLGMTRADGANADSGNLPLCARLLGQRLECRCSTRFLWDSTGLVSRLDSAMDLVTPLLRVLGNLQDVSLVLDNALITPDYLIGDLVRKR